MASKYLMKLTKEEFDQMFDKIHHEAYADGFKDGHLNGLALAMAYIYEHVTDLSVNRDFQTHLNFEHEVERMRRRISEDRIKVIENIRKAYEKKEKSDEKE